jgi:hypothetical protein
MRRRSAQETTFAGGARVEYRDDVKQEGDADTPPRRVPDAEHEPRISDEEPEDEGGLAHGEGAEPAPAAPTGIAGRMVKRLFGAESEGRSAPSRTTPKAPGTPAPASGAGVGEGDRAVAPVSLGDLRGRLERFEASVEAELASLREAHDVARAERHDELLKLLDLVSQQLGEVSSEHDKSRAEIAETRELASWLQAQIVELRNTVFGAEDPRE